MHEQNEATPEELFIDMLIRERLATNFELASIAQDALYALRVKGEHIDAVRNRYNKAISQYLSNHNWD